MQHTVGEKKKCGEKKRKQAQTSSVFAGALLQYRLFSSAKLDLNTAGTTVPLGRGFDCSGGGGGGGGTAAGGASGGRSAGGGGGDRDRLDALVLRRWRLWLWP